MKILFIITLVVLIIFLLHQNFFIIRIVGESMYPTYKDGEFVFGIKYPINKLKVGDVIVYINDYSEGRIVIKRVYDILKQEGDIDFYCLGDNPPKSYDSRYYGYFSSKNIVCKVLNQRSNKNNEVCD